MSVVSCTVSAGLFGHPKFLRFCAGAGIAPAHGLMMVVALWQGAISRLDEVIGDADDVERVMGWDGERGVLVSALLEAGGVGRAGLIEQSECGRLQVHDLWEWAPEAAVKRWRRAAAGRGAVRRHVAPFGAERRQTSPAPSPAPPPSPPPGESKNSLRGCAREARADRDRLAELATVMGRHPAHRRGIPAEVSAAWLAMVRGPSAPDPAEVEAAQARALAEWAPRPDLVLRLDRWLASISDWMQDRPLAPVVSIGRAGRPRRTDQAEVWSAMLRSTASIEPHKVALLTSIREQRVTAELEREVSNRWTAASIGGSAALNIYLDRLGREAPRPLELDDLAWLAEQWQVCRDPSQSDAVRHG